MQRHEVPTEIPEIPLPHAGEWPIPELLVELKLASSKADAKRLVEQGSVNAQDARGASADQGPVAVRRLQPRLSRALVIARRRDRYFSAAAREFTSVLEGVAGHDN